METRPLEIHRVLRPPGQLAIIYNRRDESVPWIAKMSAIVDRHRRSTPQYRSEEWRRVFDQQLFGPWTQTDFRWSQPMTGALLRDRVASISFIAQLDPSVRADVLDEIEDAARREFGGLEPFEMPHTTEIYWAPLPHKVNVTRIAPL
jgi:hypothetical protein